MKQQHLRVFFWLLLATVSFLALSPKPPTSADLGWDKLNHGAAFFALGGLARLAWPGPSWARWAVLLMLYGLLLEGAQGLTPNRQAEAGDLLADAGGLLLAALLLSAWRRIARPGRRSNPPAPPR